MQLIQLVLQMIESSVKNFILAQTNSTNDMVPLRAIFKVTSICDLFISLEPGLICEYILEYLFLSDVIHLDTSFTYTLIRPYFLKTLTIYMSKVLDTNPVVKGSQIDWLIARDISFQKCKLVDVNIDDVAKFLSSKARTLTSLDPYYNPRYDRLEAEHIVDQMSNLSNLEEANFSDVWFSSSLLSTIATLCPNLTLINLGSPYGCDVHTPEWLKGLKVFIRSCPKLKKLLINFYYLNASKVLTQIRNIGDCCGPYMDTIKTFLGSHGDDDLVNIYSTIITELPRFYPNLICVDIVVEFNRIVLPLEISALMNQALIRLALAYPKIEELTVSFMYPNEVTDVLPYFEKLARLKCYHCDFVVRDEEGEDVRWPPHLTHFTMLNGFLDDDTITSLARCCPNLVSLEIRAGGPGGGNFGSKLTDLSLNALAAHCPKLQIVRVFAFKQMTDAGVRALACGCPLLTELNLGYPQKGPLPTSCVYEIFDHCLLLEYIVLPTYDPIAIAYLVQHGRRLHRIAWWFDELEHGFSSSASDAASDAAVYARRLPDLLQKHNWLPTIFQRDINSRQHWSEYRRKYAYMVSSTSNAW